MGLGTVRVPEALEPLFRKAEEVVSRFFAERRHDPSRGTIEIFGERYLLVRAASLSVEFFQVVDDLYGEARRGEGEAFARHILFDLAHALGKSDARNFQVKMGLEDAIARLSAGPVHFAHTGWAFVDISAESTPTPDDSFFLLYDHPYSFECDAWLEAGKTREFPVCIMNAGYSSGWCEESFGIPLVATEILCRACHDETCRFIMAPPTRIEGHVARYRSSPNHEARLRPYEIPDFFARKRIEEDLRRGIEDRTRELSETNAALRREIEERELVEKKLRQAHKLEAIALLAGGIAHDFNNLLAIMLTRTKLLEKRLPDGDSARAELGEIQRAAERAAELTKKLLAFGQVEVVRRETLEVDTIIDELMRTMVPLIGDDIVLDRRGSPATPLWVEGDRGQLEQIVMNLVVNARDAMPHGGRLGLETAAAELTAPLEVTTGTLLPGGYVRIVVEDSGVGMDDETLARIFDPFFTTKPEGHGTGLGLSTVYGTVRKAHGGILVTTTPGRGTRFAVYLPAAAPPSVREAPQIVPAAQQGSETVFVVEDENELGAAIRDTLEDYGYRVVLVEPEAALARIEAGEHLDLLVTDVVMPRISGSELARRILDVRPGMRVLFISGYNRDEALRKGILAHTTSFLAKPFLPDQLAGAVRAAIDGDNRRR